MKTQFKLMLSTILIFAFCVLHKMLFQNNNIELDRKLFYK